MGKNQNYWGGGDEGQILGGCNPHPPGFAALYSLTQTGPRGSILSLEISGCLTTLVPLRHVIWISNHSASFGQAIRQKIYAIQCLFFRKLVFEND